MVKRRKRVLRTAMAMTDIAFLLLLFFMVFAIISEQTPQQMSLPRVSAANPDAREDQYRVYVMRDGALYADDGPITLNEYAQTAAAEMERSHDFLPVILADEQTPYRHIAPLLEALRSMGVQQAGFLAERTEGVR